MCELCGTISLSGCENSFNSHMETPYTNKSTHRLWRHETKWAIIRIAWRYIIHCRHKRRVLPKTDRVYLEKNLLKREQILASEFCQVSLSPCCSTTFLLQLRLENLKLKNWTCYVYIILISSTRENKLFKLLTVNYPPTVLEIELKKKRKKKKSRNRVTAAVKTHHKSWKLSETFHDLKSEISKLELVES